MFRYVIATFALACAPAASPPDPADLPVDPDRDDDGLLDAEEEELGTDPEAADSDLDTYIDGHEVHAGTDPLDADSRVYQGYWPYNPDKDAIVDPGFTGRPLDVGDVFGRVAGTDQHGEVVDLYDFVGSNEFIIIDASATWCGVCMQTSEWLSGGEDPQNYEVLFGPARALVDSGEVRWITFMTDNGGGPASSDEVRVWDDRSPHERVPVLTDPDSHVLMGLNAGISYFGSEYFYFPSFVVLDGTTFEVLLRGFAWDAMDFVVAELADDEEEDGDGEEE